MQIAATYRCMLLDCAVIANKLINLFSTSKLDSLLGLQTARNAIRLPCGTRPTEDDWQHGFVLVQDIQSHYPIL